MTEIYAIIFDPDGVNRLKTGRVYKSKLDAEIALKNFATEHPEYKSFDELCIIPLEVWSYD